MQPENPWKTPPRSETPQRSLPQRPVMPSQQPFFVPEQPVPTQITTPPHQPKPANLSKPETAKVVLPLWVKITLPLAAVFFIIFVFLFLTAGGPVRDAKQVSDRFVAYVRDNKNSDAYALTSDLFQKSTTEQALQTAVSSISPLLKGKQATTAEAIYQKSSAAPETAVFTYSFTGPGSTEYTKTELQKDKTGKWRIINFRANTKPLKDNIE